MATRPRKAPSERPKLTVHEREAVSAAELLELGLIKLESLPQEWQTAVLTQLEAEMWQNKGLPDLIKGLQAWLEDTE